MATKHFIGKQRFDLELEGADEATAIQQEVSQLCRERLNPAFEKLFDHLAGPDQLFRLDRIELALGTISRNELFSDLFAHRLLTLLETAIARAFQQHSHGAVRQPLRLGHFES